MNILIKNLERLKSDELITFFDHLIDKLEINVKKLTNVLRTKWSDLDQENCRT